MAREHAPRPRARRPGQAGCRWGQNQLGRMHCALATRKSLPHTPSAREPAEASRAHRCCGCAAQRLPAAGARRWPSERARRTGRASTRGEQSRACRLRGAGLWWRYWSSTSRPRRRPRPASRARAAARRLRRRAGPPSCSATARPSTWAACCSTTGAPAGAGRALEAQSLSAYGAAQVSRACRSAR